MSESVGRDHPSTGDEVIAGLVLEWQNGCLSIKPYIQRMHFCFCRAVHALANVGNILLPSLLLEPINVTCLPYISDKMRREREGGSEGERTKLAQGAFLVDLVKKQIAVSRRGCGGPLPKMN